jgi:hypothetical protein
MSQRLRWSKKLSILMITIGTILITYMIIIEGEPGALPLFFTLSGIVWFSIIQYRIKKQL